MSSYRFAMSILIALVVSAVALSAPIIGDTVVTSKKAELVNDGKVGTALGPGERLRVREVGRDLLTVDAIEGGGSGQISRDGVIPLKDAGPLFSDLIREHPTEGKYYRGRAAVYLVNKNYDAAVADFGEAIRIDTKDAKAYAGRGLTRAEKKDWDAAVKDYTEALRLDPKSVAVYLDRATAWRAKKDPDAAITDYTAALKLDPKSIAALLGRADVHEERKKWELAIADYGEILKLDPDRAGVYARRASAWVALGDFDKAIADRTELIRLFPNNAWGYADRAEVWRKKGQLDKAAADLGEAIRLRPDSDLILERRVAVWEEAKRWDRAATDLARLCELEPKNPMWRPRWADALVKGGDHAGAIRVCEDGLRLTPRALALLNELAWVLATAPDAKLRDGQRAVVAATRSCALDGWRSPVTLDTLAAAYAETGDFEAAVHWQGKAVTLSPPSQRAEFRARLRLYETGRPYRLPTPTEGPRP